MNVMLQNQIKPLQTQSWQETYPAQYWERLELVQLSRGSLCHARNSVDPYWSENLHFMTYLRWWLSESLTVVFLGSLDVTIWVDASIMSQFSTIETTIRVNWRVVSYWCTWAISMMIWNMWCLLARMLGLLGWTLQLRILQIISTWLTRTKLRTLWWVEAGTCIADCPRDCNLRFCSPSFKRLFSRPVVLFSNVTKSGKLWLCSW
jgi:hypothetical protein